MYIYKYIFIYATTSAYFPIFFRLATGIISFRSDPPNSWECHLEQPRHVEQPEEDRGRPSTASITQTAGKPSQPFVRYCLLAGNAAEQAT